MAGKQWFLIHFKEGLMIVEWISLSVYKPGLWLIIIILVIQTLKNRAEILRPLQNMEDMDQNAIFRLDPICFNWC